MVTAILAFIEVIILVVMHFKNGNKEAAKVEEKTNDVTGEAEKDTFRVADKNVPTIVPENKPAAVAAKKNSINKRKISVENIQTLTSRPKKDSTVLSVATAERTVEVKEVSDEKMLEILTEIRQEKTESGIAVKCVSIQIVNRINADNGHKIAKFLRENGYVISGREVVKGTQNGIKLTSVGPCLKLSIGAL
ncbi:hypothetical protein [Segetibacter aerophilus]|uniref:Uncharacterized protein n=1 Tax=Segetibacter aerophilus TaxID=670293 RepID=A0A512B9A8_9BACT|nr:hypothetical protein [Segetibacter aerophilus]GEO08554.1 hypothetical protein SAE01_10500 [Segetibacter aerophilus]